MDATNADLQACTVGVLRLPQGLLFFKNRDLSVAYHDRRITAVESSAQMHALKGFNLKTGALEGVSIGVNPTRVCVANTHIQSSDAVTYDLLCERLLQEARDRTDIPAIVAHFVEQQPVQGGRILVAAPGWGVLVEVLDREFRLEEIEGDFVMTNHFSLIPHQPQRPAVREHSSAQRLAAARELLETTTHIGGVKSLLRSHLPEKGELSICNHQADGGGTESSHIIQIQGDYVGWSSAIGFPCENDYHTVQLF